PPSADRQKKPASYQGDKGQFVPVVPVPEGAPPRLPKHPYRGEPERVWEYRRGADLYGYVYRFRTSDGGKEIVPLTWCQSVVDGTRKWSWKTWDQPRPLYLPSGSLRAGVPKVIVEGEKCADALHQVLGAEVDVIAWPGGGKVCDRAAWEWLDPPSGSEAQPLKVFLWPDADYKRRKLTAQEKAAGLDDDSPEVDFLPARKQPGVSAMEKVAGILYARQEAQIWMARLPDPPERPGDPRPLPDGWDCADAIADGWDAEKCREFLRKARRWEPTAPGDSAATRFAGASEASSAPDPDDPKGWRVALLRNDDGQVRVARENVVLALQSLPQVKGKIAFNEFSNDVIKLADMPWGSPAGKWSEVDELLMGEWLVRSQYFPSMPRTTLEEAMRMVATRHQYHPVREYLRGLTWDGQPRLNDWLIRAAVGEPDKLTKRERRYLQRVSAWFLMGMVARAMRPGCKFDYMPILEGQQGMRKSTVLNVLAGDWFADTGFVLGDKDSLQMLQGRWLYEISELDAMARAEVTKIKAFVASKSDWYRASFDKRPREYPRQLVFAGTTNEHQYLVDGTGNRRFWPVDVTRVIDTDWVAEVRDQLFAEAWARVQHGERYHPTQREELELFLPQQKSRMVESPIEVRILDYLVNHADGQLQASVQIVTLLSAIGIDITKLGPGRFHERQAGTALRKFGWERKRAKLPGRPWIYVKPPGWPECMNLDDLDDPPPNAERAPADQGSSTPQPAPERADHDDGHATDPIVSQESEGDEPF
ncbi:MAG TPA: VapE domain-containing protein, partial [Ramlibacter sp.]|nr:VapE domain-containing protein [Ramlibacter sp.]